MFLQTDLLSNDVYKMFNKINWYLPVTISFVLLQNELLDAVFETFEILMRFLGNYLFKILSHRIISSKKHHPPKNLILDKCIYCCGKLLYLIYISFYIIFIFPSFFYKSKKFLKKNNDN